MKSNIYIYKEGISNIFVLIKGQKYIIEELIGIHTMAVAYRVIDHKNNKRIGTIHGISLDEHFIPIEEERENKLNLLFDGV